MKHVAVGIRRVQADLCLKKENSQYADWGIKPAEASEALKALLSAKAAGRLGDLKDPETRRILWTALLAAHPMLRLYASGVALTDYWDDEAVLRETLEMVRLEWEKIRQAAGIAGTIRRKDAPPVDDWMVDALANLLRFQAIGTERPVPPDSSLSRMEALAVEALTETGKGITMVPAAAPSWKPAVGADEIPLRNSVPPARTAVESSVDAAVTGRMDDFSRMARVAEALARNGTDAQFWSAAAVKNADSEVDTIAETPLVVFPAGESGPAGEWVAVGPGYVLDGLAGRLVRRVGDYLIKAFAGDDPRNVPEKLGAFQHTGGTLRNRVDGKLFELPASGNPADYLRDQGIFFLRMRDVLEGHGLLAPWAECFQCVLDDFEAKGERRNVHFPRAVLGLSAARRSGKTFGELARSSLNEQVVRVFESWFTHRGFQLHLIDADPATGEEIPGRKRIYACRPWREGDSNLGPFSIWDIALADIYRRGAVFFRDMAPADLPLYHRGAGCLGSAIRQLPGKYRLQCSSLLCFYDQMGVRRVTFADDGSQTTARISGSAGRSTLALRPPFAVCVALHELGHVEQFSMAPVFDLFHGICWKNTTPYGFPSKWGLLPGQMSQKGANFFNTRWTMQNPGEQHAFWCEHYVLHPQWLRRHVRQEAEQGNFAPAVMYLYLKRITFLDLNGRALEYGLASPVSGDKPFSIGEIRQMFSSTASPTAEQKRLMELAERTETKSHAMVETKNFVFLVPLFSDEAPTLLSRTHWARTTVRPVSEARIEGGRW